MSAKLIFFFVALIFIGIGIRSILKKEASWTANTGRRKISCDPEPKYELETTHFTGPFAVIVGLIEIAIGVGILFTGIRAE